jgi:hypothetical protein
VSFELPGEQSGAAQLPRYHKLRDNHNVAQFATASPMQVPVVTGASGRAPVFDQASLADWTILDLVRLGPSLTHQSVHLASVATHSRSHLISLSGSRASCRLGRSQIWTLEAKFAAAWRRRSTPTRNCPWMYVFKRSALEALINSGAACTTATGYTVPAAIRRGTR